MSIKRKENEPPLAIKEWGWRYHHTGIPTCEPGEGEQYLQGYGLYVNGFDSSPFGIEWMRYEKDSPVHDLIKRVSHVAFEVDDIDSELKKRQFKILTQPNSPAPGIKVVMIEHNGAPVELIEFTKTEK